MEKIKGALKPNHKAACRMKIQGKCNTEIAAELNITKRTLAMWFSDGQIKEELQRLAEHIEEEFAVQLASSGMIALHELTALITKPDTAETVSVHQKIELARELMDRLPGTAKNHDRAQMTAAKGAGPNAGNNTDVRALFLNMKDDELASFLNGGWERAMESGNGSNSSQT